MAQHGFKSMALALPNVRPLTKPFDQSHPIRNSQRYHSQADGWIINGVVVFASMDCDGPDACWACGNYQSPAP